MRLIDADKLMIDLNEAQVENDENYRGLCLAKNKVYESPTIEAEPIIHAYWEEDFFGHVFCSNCKVSQPLRYYDGDYENWESPICPECGAIMDK